MNYYAYAWAMIDSNEKVLAYRPVVENNSREISIPQELYSDPDTLRKNYPGAVMLPAEYHNDYRNLVNAKRPLYNSLNR